MTTPIGFYINPKLDHGNSGYTCYCRPCSYELYPIELIDNEQTMPIFTWSESDCIRCCDYCGDLLYHSLTGDCEDCQYSSPVTIMVKYEPDHTITLEISPYSGIARRYRRVSMASLGRLMRWLIYHHKAIPDIPGKPTNRVLWYTIRQGIDRRQKTRTLELFRRI